MSGNVDGGALTRNTRRMARHESRRASSSSRPEITWQAEAYGRSTRSPVLVPFSGLSRVDEARGSCLTTGRAWVSTLQVVQETLEEAHAGPVCFGEASPRPTFDGLEPSWPERDASGEHERYVERPGRRREHPGDHSRCQEKYTNCFGNLLESERGTWVPRGTMDGVAAGVHCAIDRGLRRCSSHACPLE